jgi:hypothetical protein
MHRIALSTLVLSLAACGGGPGSEADSLEVELGIISEDGGGGRLDYTDGVTTGACEGSICGFAAFPGAGNELVITATPDDSSQFVGWSGDAGCNGTEPEVRIVVSDVYETSPGWACNATFVGTAASPPAEHVLVADYVQCGQGPSGELDCLGVPSSYLEVLDPTSDLESHVVAAGPHCYVLDDVAELSSEDHGPVRIETSIMDLTVTHNGTGYDVSGKPFNSPFAEEDSVTVTTDDDSATLPAPVSGTMVDGPNGVQLVADTATAWLWFALGGSGNGENSSQVVCHFTEPTTTLPLLHPEGVAAYEEVGFEPFVYFAGPVESAGIDGFVTIDAARLLLIDRGSIPD